MRGAAPTDFDSSDVLTKAREKVVALLLGTNPRVTRDHAAAATAANRRANFEGGEEAHRR
jgi:hypothetical protein